MDYTIDVVFSREIRSNEKQRHATECNHEMIMRVCTYVFSLNEIIPRDDFVIGVIVIGVKLRDNMRFSVPRRGEITGP